MKKQAPALPNGSRFNTSLVFVMALYVASLFSMLNANAQTSFPPATTPQQAITFFFDGLSEVNAAKLRAYVTRDFLLLEHGKIWNTDSLITAISRRKAGDFQRVNSFRYLHTEQEGETAIVAYHNRADIRRPAGQAIVVEWLESAHLVKGSDGWKLKLLHSTRMAQTTE